MSKYTVSISVQEQREHRVMRARIGIVFALCFLFWIVPAQDLHPVFIAVAALLGLGVFSMFLSRKYYVLNAPDVAIRKTRRN